jgi:hypothetical protein
MVWNCGRWHNQDFQARCLGQVDGRNSDFQSERVEEAFIELVELLYELSNIIYSFGIEESHPYIKSLNDTPEACVYQVLDPIFPQRHMLKVPELKRMRLMKVAISCHEENKGALEGLNGHTSCSLDSKQAPHNNREP